MGKPKSIEVKFTPSHMTSEYCPQDKNLSLEVKEENSSFYCLYGSNSISLHPLNSWNRSHKMKTEPQKHEVQ